MAKNGWTQYLIWGAVGVLAYVIADNMGIISQLKTKMGMQTRVSYYTAGAGRPNAPLGGFSTSNAYIGQAYSLGQQSMTGDYNSINMWDR